MQAFSLPCPERQFRIWPRATASWTLLRHCYYWALRSFRGISGPPVEGSLHNVDNYEHIFYLECPHFTVGHVDQWGEQGYLLFEDKVYSYEENRKDQCGTTHSPMAVTDFLAHAERNQISIPDEFMERLKEVSERPDGITS